MVGIPADLINEPVCVNCRFYLMEGLCRRYPPQIIVTETKGLFKRTTVQHASKFPPMSPTGWCGEFQPK